MATVKGIWFFNGTITQIPTEETVDFSVIRADGSVTNYIGMRLYNMYLSYKPNAYQVHNAHFYGNSSWVEECFRTVDFGTTEQTVSNDFYTWLTANAVQQSSDQSEPTTDILYTVNGSSLTAVANAIRAKKETTAVFTLEQMAVEIEGIVTGDSLPNAEDYAFGTLEVAQSNAITTTAPTITSNSGVTYTYGWSFEIVTHIALLGFRGYSRDYAKSRKMSMWDESGELLATATLTTKKGAWVSVLLDTPVLLKPGKYTIGGYGASTQLTKIANLSFDSRILYPTALVYAGDAMPTDSNTLFPTSDFIFQNAEMESSVTEYKIQNETLTDIADEVRRISGATGVLTTDQILTLLKAM